MASAQSSALLIDNVLAALTSIPFSPVAAYKPDVPLHTALAQVSTSLDTLIPSLATINTSLVDGKTNLGTVEVELTKISETTQGISSTLASAQSVIDQYKAVTTQLKANVEAAQHGAPNLDIGDHLDPELSVWLVIDCPAGAYASKVSIWLRTPQG